MDHDVLVEPVLDRGNRFIESLWQAPDLHSVAHASLALFVQMRQGAREILPAKIALEAQQRSPQAVAHGGPEGRGPSVHPRPVSPEPLCGEIRIPGRTFQGRGCGAPFRPDEAALGVPAVGECTAEVRWLDAPGAAALPPRVATTRCARCTSVALSSRGAPGSIDSLADDLRTWQAERAGQEAEVGGQVVGAEATAAERRGESAMDGLPAHLDGRWPPPQVAPSLGRRIEAPAEDPTLGEVLARRDVSVLGSAADVAGRITQVLREAGWEQIPRGEILGDGAPCIWNVAEAHFPGGRQPRADSHLSEPLYAFAHLRYPKNPAGAKAWVEQQRGALLPDRVGEVLSTRKRRRPWEKALCNALAPLIGDVEHTRTRRRDQEPWHTGLAGGSGAVAGACTHGIQSRFQRAGMRWKPPGFLNVLALRLAPLHGTFQAFWASRGLTVQVPG